MTPLRSASFRLLPTLLYLSLCLIVFMQMLGTPASFWQPSAPADLVKASLLEGLSLVPSTPTCHQAVASVPYLDVLIPRPSIMPDESLFRPPTRSRPPMLLV